MNKIKKNVPKMNASTEIDWIQSDRVCCQGCRSLRRAGRLMAGWPSNSHEYG